MHLELRSCACGRHTQQHQGSAPKKLPRSRAAKRGNSMAWRAPGDRFGTCVGAIFSVKRCVQNLEKKEGFVAEGFNLHLALASGCSLNCVGARVGVTPGKTRAQHRKSFPEGAGKRGNSMAWRAPGARFWTCVGVIFSVKRCVPNL